MNDGSMMAESNNPYALLVDDVPEPATWTFGGVGLLGLAMWRRRGAVQRDSR
jgi:MYXO-CTERM domain-containing protein